MSKIRDKFYGKVPKSKPAILRRSTSRNTRGKNDCPELPLHKAQMRFDQPQMTQFAGYYLLKRFTLDVGLQAHFGEFVEIAKRSNGYPASLLGCLLAESKILGCRRLMHIDDLRHDPLLAQANGLDAWPCGKTFGEYLKTYADESIKQLDELNTHYLGRLWRRFVGEEERKEFIDYDSTLLTVYGKQEKAERTFNYRHKDKPHFQPKVAFLGSSGLMVNMELYPGNKNLPGEFDSFHEETLSRIPSAACIRGVRGDTALFDIKRIKKLEDKKNPLLYGIGAPINERLRECIWDIPRSRWLETMDAKGRPISVAEIYYKPATWDKARTFIISRRLKEDAFEAGYLFEQARYKYFAFVTNYPGDTLDRFKFCVERCSLESCIKEAKLGLDLNALPCREFNANRAYLRHIQLAHNTAIFFRYAAMPRRINRWTVPTLRRRLLRVPGQFHLTDSGGMVFHLPEKWPYKDLMARIAHRLHKIESREQLS